MLDQPERGAPFKQIHVPVNYVHDKGKDYLVIADVALKGLVELKPPYGIDPVPQKSFFFARYSVRGNRIELDDVDSEAAAKLVVDRRLAGYRQQDGQRTARLRARRSRGHAGNRPQQRHIRQQADAWC